MVLVGQILQLYNTQYCKDKYAMNVLISVTMLQLLRKELSEAKKLK